MNLHERHLRVLPFSFFFFFFHFSLWAGGFSTPSSRLLFVFFSMGKIPSHLVLVSAFGTRAMETGSSPVSEVLVASILLQVKFTSAVPNFPDIFFFFQRKLFIYIYIGAGRSEGINRNRNWRVWGSICFLYIICLFFSSFGEYLLLYELKSRLIHNIRGKGGP